MEDHSISKYDRLRGGLEGVALFSRQSTIRNIQNITGRAETFIIETGRHEELGDFIFIECLDEGQPVRLALPPRAANIIAAQRESLTRRRRSIAGKAQAKSRMERGEVPGFMRKRVTG